MMQYFNKIRIYITELIGKIHWTTKVVLSLEEKEKIKKLLTDNYYVILTRKTNHLSAYFIGLIDLILTGRFGRWSHVLINMEDEVQSPTDFRLIESTGTGVHYSSFDTVFDVQEVCLLKPKCMTLEKWTDILDAAKAQLGKPYDTLFNIADDKQLSCVELVRTILMDEKNYCTDFAEFERMIKWYENLTPQMFYDCTDFEVVYSVKAK